MLEKSAITQAPIADLIAHRWSPRAIDPDQPVGREPLLALLEAARWAPSCFGDQPWRYLVWDRFHDAASWQQAFECLAEGNQVWVKNAPVSAAVGGCSELRPQRPAEPLGTARYRRRQRESLSASHRAGLGGAPDGLVSIPIGPRPVSISPPIIPAWR
jgi:nitroreductase